MYDFKAALWTAKMLSWILHKASFLYCSGSQRAVLDNCDRIVLPRQAYFYQKIPKEQ
jgi:hypothetical protein